MMIKYMLLKCAATAALIVLFIPCVVTISRALSGDVNNGAGLLTLQLKFTALLPDAILEPSILNRRDLLDVIQSKVSDAGSTIATAAPDVMDQVQDAADGVASSLSGQIEAILPKNVSVGMTEFCINSTQETTCRGLPINLRSVFVIGLVSLSAIIPLSMTFLFGWFSLLVGNVLNLRILRTVIHFVLCLILFVPLAAPITVLYLIRLGAQQLPEWIVVQPGNIYGLLTAGLGCAIAMVVLSCVFRFFL